KRPLHPPDGHYSAHRDRRHRGRGRRLDPCADHLIIRFLTGEKMSFVQSLEPRLMMARVLGIDVSHYQGTINWPAVFASGERFAFEKATEGVTYTDPKFVTNMLAGKAAGVLMGAYHFARPLNNSAADEAAHFLA